MKMIKSIMISFRNRVTKKRIFISLFLCISAYLLIYFISLLNPWEKQIVEKNNEKKATQIVDTNVAIEHLSWTDDNQLIITEIINPTSESEIPDISEDSSTSYSDSEQENYLISYYAITNYNPITRQKTIIATSTNELIAEPYKESIFICETRYNQKTNLNDIASRVNIYSIAHANAIDDTSSPTEIAKIDLKEYFSPQNCNDKEIFGITPFSWLETSFYSLEIETENHNQTSLKKITSKELPTVNFSTNYDNDSTEIIINQKRFTINSFIEPIRVTLSTDSTFLAVYDNEKNLFVLSGD